MAGPRRSLKMSPENWAVIDKLAADLNTTASTGSRAGLPSWRSLLYQVATSKLVVVRATTLHCYMLLANDTSKAVNRLEVKPRSAGAKRRILARLRAANIGHGQDQGVIKHEQEGSQSGK